MKRPRLSLRLALPLAALGAFLLISVVSVGITDWRHRQAMLERVQLHAQREAARLARLAERRLLLDPTSVEQEVMLQGSEASASVGVLLDSTGRVLFAQRTDWKGAAIAHLLPAWDDVRFKRVTRGLALDLEVENEGRRLSALMPFAFRETGARGAVYLEYDLTGALQAERRENLSHRVPDLVAALILTLMLAFWLHRRLAGPLDALAETSQRVARGDFAVRAPESGFREVAQLAADFNGAIGKWQADRAALTRNDTQLRALVRGIPDLVWLKDPDGVYLTCNPAFERFFGAAESDIVGRTDYDFVDAELADFFRANDRAAMSASMPRANEEWVTLASDGRRILLETLKTPMVDPDGNLVGVLGIGRDITEHRRLEEALRGERDHSQRYLDMVEVIILALDDQGRITLINRKGRELLGYSEEELLGANWFERCLPAHIGPDLFRDVHRRVMLGELVGAEYVENPILTRDGRERLIAWRNTLLRDADGRVNASLSVGEDITERQATVVALAQREEQLRTLINAMPDIVCFKDGEGRWLEANDFDLRLFQLEGIDYRGKKDSELAAYQDFYRDAFLGCEDSDEIAWRAGGPSRAEETIPRPDGHAKVFDIIKVPLFHDDGRRKGLVVIGRDITEQKEAQKRAEHLAYYDALTGLPNRTLLLDRLGLTLAVSRRQGRQDALLLLNVDRFKTINDARGHGVGDKLLRALGQRLGASLRDGDTLAHLSGDEFAILLPDLARQNDTAARMAMSVAEKIQTAVRAPFHIDGDAFHISASLGIALFPENVDDLPADILRRADTALHQAKEAGVGHSAFFEVAMGAQVQKRFELERELRQAIAGGELRLYLQPQVDMDGRVVGAEALVRWQHPVRGLVPPGAFIPLAEESDLIVDVETWVLSEVCHLLVREEMAGRSLRLAVNISPRHFRQPGFVAWIGHLLAASGVDATHLTLEITEGLMIENMADVVAKMSALADLGFHFSIDDFGTGYSSLAYLKRLPIHELKIDRSFVQDAPDDPNDAALVEAILAVAQHLHLQVVAEGVETAAQAEFLNRRARIIHQGYLYGRPAPAEDWLATLRERA